MSDGTGEPDSDRALYAYDTIRPETIVYVDAFNLYYGCLRRTPYRWLDLGKWLDLVLPQHEVIGIRYFTAIVKPRPDKKTSATDQLAYIHALGSDPRINIVHGKYQDSKKTARLAEPPHKRVKVLHSEEKGSDVNLASHLVCDAARRRMEAAVLVTNDSDLLLAATIAKEEFGIEVSVLNPQASPARAFIGIVKVSEIRAGALLASQFPPVIDDVDGRRIYRPKGWETWGEGGSARFKPPDGRLIPECTLTLRKEAREALKEALKPLKKRRRRRRRRSDVNPHSSTQAQATKGIKGTKRTG